MRGRPAEITYEDGIYVGYRFYETYRVSTSYEFGYGLSYTTFACDNLKLSSPGFNGKSGPISMMRPSRQRMSARRRNSAVTISPPRTSNDVWMG